MEDKELSKEKIVTLITEGKDKFYIPLVLEVGSYDGKDSRELANILDRESIFYCFEADKRSQDIFHKLNYQASKHLNLIEFAVGNIDGAIDFHLSDSDTRRHDHNKDSWSASSSIKKPKTHLELFKDVDFKRTVRVPCIKLDSWFRIANLNMIVDFIWVDINGAEEDFILGGLKTLNESTRYLYIEFSDKELYEGQITKDQISKLLPNFEILGVYNFKGNFGNLLLKNKTL